MGSSSQPDSHFEFDAVEHFNTDHKRFETEDESIYTKVAQNQQEEILLNILISQETSFKDTVLISRLEEVGFNKTKLSVVNVNELKKLFNPKKSKYGETVFCAPIFNDFLVFKKKNKIIGFAKICFSCGKMITVTEDLIERLSAPNENFLEIKKVLNR